MVKFIFFTLNVALLVQSALVSAAVPRIDHIMPRGGQIGKTVKLTLIGQDLSNNTRLKSNIPGALTPLAPPRNKDFIGKQLSFLLEISPEAQVGTYQIRVQTHEGLSNILLFTVGAFPETTDSEVNLDTTLSRRTANDSFATAQPVEIPTTINGTLDSADQDFYSFEMSKGQDLILEVEARRIGSAVDPSIEIFDDTGDWIDRNGDAVGIGVDSRLQFIAPKAGTYVVAIRDSKFSRQQQNYYRLKIANYAVADGIYPLGAQRGSTSEITFFGGNLKKTLKTKVVMMTDDPAAEFITVPVPGALGSLPFRVAIDDKPSHDEPSAAPKNLPSETWINGQISASNERDRYHLTVEPGQNWQIELQAAKLGTSQLHGVLNLFDGQGTPLGTTREIGLRFKKSSLDVSENPNADQHISFTVPENITTIQVEVEDLLERGGPTFGYRLMASRRSGYFTLNIEDPELNIPLRGSAVVKVKINRLNYLGPIRLSIPNLPPDWTMNGGNVPMLEQQGSRESISVGLLTLTPNPGAIQRSADLQIWGEATIDGVLVRRQARNPGMKTLVSFQIGPEEQLENVAPWLGTNLPTSIIPERAAGIELLVPHYVKLLQGSKTEFPFEFTARRGKVTPLARIDRRSLRQTEGGVRFVAQGGAEAKNPHKGTLIVGVQPGWGPARFDVALQADINIADSVETVYSQAITIDIVRPYAINPLHDRSSLQSGTNTILTARLDRQLGFDRPVTITAENLPLGLSCTEIQVDGTVELFELPCHVAATTKTGEYVIDLSTSSTLLDGEDKVIPFSPPSFQLKVNVLPVSPSPADVSTGL